MVYLRQRQAAQAYFYMFVAIDRDSFTMLLSYDQFFASDLYCQQFKRMKETIAADSFSH